MEVNDLSRSNLRDADAMLQLNNEHSEETSLLDLGGLNALLDSAFLVLGVDRGATAFLITLDHHASYKNPNFMWFKARRELFVYVDRIIVSHTLRGQGVARRMYNELFAAATRAGLNSVVCEVNIDPPNPVSEAFHASMGFTRIGEATIHGGAKSVAYLEKFLT